MIFFYKKFKKTYTICEKYVILSNKNKMKGNFRMKKLRIYLDTSVISYLDQQDTPEQMKQTQELWEIFKTDKYDVIISDIAFSEISKCSDEKIKILNNYINQVDYIEYNPTEEAKELVTQLIEEGVLTDKQITDCYHIASAILSDCNIILSWNFKHLVNIDTINGIRRINLKNRFNSFIDIYPPYVLLKKEDD